MKASRMMQFVAMFAATIAIGSPSSDAAEEGLRSLRVGHLVAIDMAPHFVAKEAGYFEDEGLEVSFFLHGVHENNEALAKGELDISITPYTLPYLAQDKGVPIKAVAAAGGWGVVQLIVQGDFGIETLAELADYVRSHPDEKLRVGALKGDNIDLMVTDSLRSVGLTRDDVEVVLVRHILDLVELFKNNDLDLLSHIKPYTTDLVANHGALFLIDDSSVWNPHTPNCVVGVMESFLQEHPDIVEAYLKAVMRAADLINRDPNAAVALLERATYPNYFKAGSDVVLSAFRTQPYPISFTPNMTAITSVMFEMVQSGYINEFIASRDVFDLEIIRRLEATESAASTQ